jgi:hypothetical protein
VRHLKTSLMHAKVHKKRNKERCVVKQTKSKTDGKVRFQGAKVNQKRDKRCRPKRVR